MKKIVLAITCLLALSACNEKEKITAQDFNKGMNAYLAQRGNFCLGKTNWPIDVTQRDMDGHGRDAIQMPVMEKIGLVKSTMVTVEIENTDDGTAKKVDAMRYELTDEGKKYYLPQPVQKGASGNAHEASNDLCAAKLTLDKIVAWEPPKTNHGTQSTVVTYTYHVESAPWANNPDIQKVLPMVSYIVHGDKKTQLKESFVLTPDGWKSVDL